jgi:hypothetical protein
MSVSFAITSYGRGRRLLRAAFVALIATVAAGCVHAPRPTGYLENYHGLVRQPMTALGVYAERMPAGKQSRLDHVLQILPSRWDADRLPEPSREKELLDLLDNRLLVHLQRLAPPSVIVTRTREMENLDRRGANITQLRVSITHLEKGFGLFRMLLGGFMYLGATELQVEGRLVDYRTQQVLVRLARRGMGNGVVLGLPTPQSLSPRFCWRLSIDETALHRLATPPSAGAVVEERRQKE